MGCQSWGHFPEEEEFGGRGHFVARSLGKKSLLKKIEVRGFSFHRRLTFWLYKLKKSSIWQWLKSKNMNLAARQRRWRE